MLTTAELTAGVRAALEATDLSEEYRKRALAAVVEMLDGKPHLMGAGYGENGIDVWVEHKTNDSPPYVSETEFVAIITRSVVTQGPIALPG